VVGWIRASARRCRQSHFDRRGPTAITSTANACPGAEVSRFNPRRTAIEWVETGPFLRQSGKQPFEANLVHLPGEWWPAGRGNGEVGWARSKRPVRLRRPRGHEGDPARQRAADRASLGADGVVRLSPATTLRLQRTTVRESASLLGWCRWTAIVCRDEPARDLFERQRELPSGPRSQAKLDSANCSRCPNARQLVVHGVSTRAFESPYPSHPGIPIQNTEEKNPAVLLRTDHLSQGLPPLWASLGNEAREPDDSSF